MNPNNAAYVDAWRGYRRWARLRWVAFLGYIPFGLAIVGLNRWLGVPLAQMGPGDGPPALVVAWFFFFGVTVIVAGAFKCPRCKKQFFSTGWWRNPLTSRCLNCRLQKWATRDPDCAT